MKKKITNIYAKVFFHFWMENPKYIEELNLFVETLKENEVLQKVLLYNTVSKTERKNVLIEILSKLLNERIVIGYILYLNENKRLNFIFQIFEEIKKIIYLHAGFRKVYVEGTGDHLEERVLEIFNVDEEQTIVVVGAMGEVGKRLTLRLQKLGYQVTGLDKGDDLMSLKKYDVVETRVNGSLHGRYFNFFSELGSSLSQSLHLLHYGAKLEFNFARLLVQKFFFLLMKPSFKGNLFLSFLCTFALAGKNFIDD